MRIVTFLVAIVTFLVAMTKCLTKDGRGYFAVGRKRTAGYGSRDVKQLSRCSHSGDVER